MIFTVILQTYNYIFIWYVFWGFKVFSQVCLLYLIGFILSIGGGEGHGLCILRDIKYTSLNIYIYVKYAQNE